MIFTAYSHIGCREHRSIEGAKTIPIGQYTVKKHDYVAGIPCMVFEEYPSFKFRSGEFNLVQQPSQYIDDPVIPSVGISIYDSNNLPKNPQQGDSYYDGGDLFIHDGKDFIKMDSAKPDTDAFWDPKTLPGKPIGQVRDAVRLHDSVVVTVDPLTGDHSFTISKPECECGTDKIGGGIHSDWCPKYGVES